MKIGIITMHRLHNYGSFLQAFSLKILLEEMGHICTFIDVKAGKALDDPTSKKTNGRLSRNIKRLVKYKFKIFEALRWRIGISKMFNTESPKWLEFSNKQIYNDDFDLVIIGSDEVFNCTDPCLGYRPSLFGDGILTKQLISYAASFGFTTSERIAKYKFEELLTKDLKNFHSISVRDKNSYSIISKLSNIKPLISLDPVFICDYKEYMPEISEDNFILIYSYLERIKDKKQITEIKQFAKSVNMKIISIFSYYTWCDQNIIAKPFEVLSFFKKASYVITDTFHGTVFSIKMNRQFITFVKESNHKKLFYLLERFNLEKRSIKKPDNIAKVLMENIDYSGINNVITCETEISINYLKKYTMN